MNGSYCEKNISSSNEKPINFIEFTSDKKYKQPIVNELKIEPKKLRFSAPPDEDNVEIEFKNAPKNFKIKF